MLNLQLVFASANISSFGTALSNAPMAHIGFFASLILFEILFVKFWVNGTLGQILLQSLAIGVVAFFTGRAALGEVMKRRSGTKSS